MPFDAIGFEAAQPVKQLPTTPRGRMEYLRDFLKELPDERFNIANLFTGPDGAYISSTAPEELYACGTTACIKGWSHYLFSDVSKFGSAWGEELGLSEDDADELFMPGAHDDRPNNYAEAPARYTRAAAVRVLDIYLAEQVVDWERAIKETAGA